MIYSRSLCLLLSWLMLMGCEQDSNPTIDAMQESTTVVLKSTVSDTCENQRLYLFIDGQKVSWTQTEFCSSENSIGAFQLPQGDYHMVLSLACTDSLVWSRSLSLHSSECIHHDLNVDEAEIFYHCTDSAFAPLSLEGMFGCRHTEHDWEINAIGEKMFVLITSQEEFDTVVSAPCQPLINFDSTDFFIGKVNGSSGAYFETRAHFQCQDSSSTLMVDFWDGDAADNRAAFYHGLVPKGFLPNDVLPTINRRLD